MLRFAGARGLDIISRALGLPSVRRTRLRAMVPALQTSASTRPKKKLKQTFALSMLVEMVLHHLQPTPTPLRISSLLA